MTPEEFDTWRDFALRMSRTLLWTKNARPSRAWVEEHVRDFFDWNESELRDATCWDNGETLVCDLMTEFETEVAPYPFGLDYGKDDKYDERMEMARRKWEDQWGGPVRFCVRSGIDMVATPGAGTVGATAGDLRRMYPDGLPSWLTNKLDKFVVGPFVDNPSPAGPFETWSDDATVWL